MKGEGWGVGAGAHPAFKVALREKDEDNLRSADVLLESADVRKVIDLSIEVRRSRPVGRL